MIYYSVSEILQSVAMAASFGAFLCALAVIMELAFDFFGALIRIPSYILRFSATKKSVLLYLKERHSTKLPHGKSAEIIKDLLFLCASGFFLSLLFYVASDGEIRAYIFAVALLSYSVCKKTLGVFMYGAFSRIFSAVFKITSASIFLIVLPMRYLFSKAAVITVRLMRISKKRLKRGKKRKE